MERRVEQRIEAEDAFEMINAPVAGQPQAPAASLEAADAYLTLVETGNVAGDAVDREVERRLMEMSYTGGGAASGKEAVTSSEALQFAIRGDKVRRTSLIRKVGDRSFINIGGVWVDQSVKKDLEMVKVKFASDAYFKLYEALPKLKDALALGDKLVIGAGKYVLIIDDDGEESTDAAGVAAVIKVLSSE